MDAIVLITDDEECSLKGKSDVNVNGMTRVW